MQILNVCTPGHADPFDSYGLICCQLARHLTALGCYVNVLALGDRQHANQPEDVKTITGQPILPALGGVLLGYPTSHNMHTGLCDIGPKVALTMFESSKLPEGWADILNTMNAVIVPSSFCADVFAEGGVTAPIHVVPLGVGEVYKPVQRPTDGPFTFLAFLDRGRRKGGIAALQAFVQAFGDDTGYRLILKSRRPRIVADITNPNITLIQQDMTEQELYQLYCTAHALVNPNMGEGFGLIPREFAATGGIAMATGWGGTADDIDVWGVRLPYRLIKADWGGHKRFAGKDLGSWAEPDIEGVAALMRHVADERQVYTNRAMQQAPHVPTMYNWRDFASNVLKIWQEATNGA
jgi:glycosyltransferase involved in cell wall biosynthesis